MGKFDAVPGDLDTRIIISREMEVEENEVLHQVWLCEGIQGESLIFCSEDVCDLDDESLEALVKDTPVCKGDSSITISRKEQYTFTNFNFKVY